MEKLKQSQLAKQLGISKSYLSMVLSGKRKANSELISKLQSIPGVHKLVNNQLQEVLPKQGVGSSNLLTRSIHFIFDSNLLSFYNHQTFSRSLCKQNIFSAIECYSN